MGLGNGSRNRNNLVARKWNEIVFAQKYRGRAGKGNGRIINKYTLTVPQFYKEWRVRLTMNEFLQKLSGGFLIHNGYNKSSF